MAPAGISVYAGTGSSHSWTWLADLFENRGLLNVHFMDEGDFVNALDANVVGTAIVSGGDGFALAEALGTTGFDRLRLYIETGGLYVGICAGAYLPLPSSLQPFSRFNISSTKIDNIRCGKTDAEISPRVAVTYGECSVFHPVRGPMRIGSGSDVFTAPLYGGPVFKEPGKDAVLMRYLSFTENTEFQMDRKEAESLVLGKPALINCHFGNGNLILAGPHLEHPSYPQANERFMELLLQGHSEPATSEAVVPSKRSKNLDVLKSVSDLKVAILGLENRSFTVGRKSWDGGRLLELVSAVEKRAWSLEKAESKKVIAMLNRARTLIIGMQTGIDQDSDETTQLLVRSARMTVESHFEHLAHLAGD